MRNNRRLSIRLTLLVSLLGALTITLTRLQADTGTCGGVTTTVAGIEPVTS